MITGKKGYYDDSLEIFSKEQKDIERFNTEFKFRAKSLKDISLFKHWLDVHDMDMRRFSKLRGFFDLEKRKIYKVKSRLIVAQISAGSFAYILAFVFLSLAMSDSALLKFKGEEQWLWLNHENASSVNILLPFNSAARQWNITKEDCAKPSFDLKSLSATSMLSEESVSVVCESFSSSEDINRIDNVIDEQWTLGIISFLSLMIIFLYLLREIVKGADALMGRKYLYRRLKKARLRRIL
ncbi:hypothetical protein EUZ85_17470 [Hahella sp. KA22]|nr:hypothetical protein ENC22_14895 [Hahella sp. KA22]QAY55788.1 hypothetical protein EUZ85_17470 [Hahella sp. KA22]